MRKASAPPKIHVTQANASALFHTDGPYLSIRRTCCAGVDSVTDCDYNNYIENLKNVLKKVQSAFCPLLVLFQVNHQNIPKNTCRNEPGKRLNKPVPERQGKNEYRPIEGIDTASFSASSLAISASVEMSIARLRALTHHTLEGEKQDLHVEMSIARLRALTLSTNS